MRISHGTRIDNWHTENGYGYVTDRMIESLTRLGHTVRANDRDAPVQIWYDQPHHWKWNDTDQYRIGYHPWESTKMKKSWIKAMNEADEIWTPSPLVKEWYIKMGINPPVYIYEHGVDHNVWVPEKRSVTDKMRFLHVGGEAVRKGADIVLDAFRIAFPNQDDVELTLKMNQDGWNIPRYGKINVLPNIIPLSELVELYHSHHVFVYPSWGEGFGLNPLQAMATGMPTLISNSWAPYGYLIPDSQVLKATLAPSPWPKIHPGKMFKHELDDVVDHMRYMYENFDNEARISFDVADEVHEDYDWINLTKEAFIDLENRLKI